MIKCDLGIKEIYNKRLAYGTATAGGDRKAGVYVTGSTPKICLQIELLRTEKKNCKIILSSCTLVVEILSPL